MAEDLIIDRSLDKASKYESLLPQIEGLITGEEDLIANLANISAALKEIMGFFWVGFYLVKNNELVLGPFQGPVACTRIKKGNGVCGTAWEENRIVNVEDVDNFSGHIACSYESKSEIVLPVLKNNEVVLILDIDSDKLKQFDKTDEIHLQKIVELIEKIL